MTINDRIKSLYYNSDNQIIKNSDLRSYNLLAKKALQNGDLKEAYILFHKIHSVHGCAYCKFLNGELDEAKALLMTIKDSSSAVNWLLSLINILKGKFNEYPTYLQIRSFYEQDLDMLLLCKQVDIAEKLINKNSYLSCFNGEVYKYSARVLYNYNKIDEAEKYIKKSLDIFYKDPETHFILGEIYLKKNLPEKAKKSFLTSTEVVNGYLPSLKKIKELSRY